LAGKIGTISPGVKLLDPLEYNCGIDILARIIDRFLDLSAHVIIQRFVIRSAARCAESSIFAANRSVPAHCLLLALQ
jgi:hypothetical protein